MALVAHTHYLCGVDVSLVDPDPQYSRTDALLNQLSPSGQAHVFRQLQSNEAMSRYLQLNWACKEAYTKAVGVGVYGDFKAISFVPELPMHWVDVECKECNLFQVVRAANSGDGKEQADLGLWSLWVEWIKGAQGWHVLVTALGAPKYCEDGDGEFKASLLCPEEGPPDDNDCVYTQIDLTVEDLLACPPYQAISSREATADPAGAQEPLEPAPGEGDQDLQEQHGQSLS